MAGDDGRPGRFHAHREAADGRPDTGQDDHLCPGGSFQDAPLAIPWGVRGSRGSWGREWGKKAGGDARKDSPLLLLSKLMGVRIGTHGETVFSQRNRARTASLIEAGGFANPPLLRLS